MKQSIGYTLSLNIAIIFIVIVFAFIAMALSYYRAFKVSKVITATIEKNEGYTLAAEEEILKNLSIIGYNMTKVTCAPTKNGCTRLDRTDPVMTNGTSHYNGDRGYCVYYCNDGDYYRYKTTTNMLLNIPIVNSLPVSVEINTNKMYEYNITRESFNDEEFNEDDTFTVPSTGRYRITAYGAQGGGTSKAAGGKGAKVETEFDLNAGDTLNITIGRQGTCAEVINTGMENKEFGNGHFCTGGGKTIVSNSSTSIIVAGGGGGAIDYYSYIPGGNAGSEGKTCLGVNCSGGAETGQVCKSENKEIISIGGGAGEGCFNGHNGDHCANRVGSGGGGSSCVASFITNYTTLNGNDSPNTGDGKVTIKKL